MDKANPEQYLLSEAQHQAIFDQHIKPLVFQRAEWQGVPTAVIFGGQPGAGKSAAVEQASAEFAKKGGAVRIIGDELRAFHPKFAELMAKDDQTAAFYTDRDSGRWIEKAIDHARKAQVNIVIEGTMRDPRKVADTMKGLLEAGYKVDARALAVNERLSWQGVLQRYESQQLDRGAGRMTTKEAHSAAYSGMLETLARIETEKLADHVKVYQRGGVLIYANEATEGRWSFPPEARQLVEAERSRPFTTEERADYAKGFDKLAELVSRPERRASPRQIEEIAILQQAAHQQLSLPPVETRERLVISNGSRRIERNHGDAEWVANKVEAAGNLKPGVYNLYEAKAADKTVKASYSGPIVHVSRESVYQQTATSNLVRHARHNFEAVPEVGRSVDIAYKAGRAIQLDAGQAGVTSNPYSIGRGGADAPKPVAATHSDTLHVTPPRLGRSR